MADVLANHPATYFSSQCIGRYDVMVGARFRSLEEIAEFVEAELGAIGDIVHTETLVQVAPSKYYGFGPSRSNPEE